MGFCSEPIYHIPGKLSKGAVLDVGLKCTHSCKFCYYSYLDKSDNQFSGMRRAHFRTFEENKQILTLLKKNSFINFDVTGGEPTLHPDIVELMRYAHQDLGLYGRIITLGQFLMKKMPNCKNEKLIDDLLETGLTNFLFSFHSADKDIFKKTTDESLDELLSAMNYLDEKGFQYTSNTTVFEWNYKTLPTIAKEITKHGIYLHNFIIMNAYYEWNQGGKIFGVQAKYNKIFPYLKEAVEILESENIAVNIRYAPLCAFKGLEKNLVGVVGVRYDPYEWMNRAGHFGGTPELCAEKYQILEGDIEKDYQLIEVEGTLPNGNKITGMRGNHFKYFSGKCKNCAAKNVCDGIDPQYLGQNNGDEFEPYFGKEIKQIIHPDRLKYTMPYIVKTGQYQDMKTIFKDEFKKYSFVKDKEVEKFSSNINTKPKISVVIPVYNQAEYLKFAVEKIINQSYKNWELIIVDDGSTDNSFQIAKQLKKNYSKYDIKVISKINGGVADARNEGIKSSTSDWILLLDSDDEFKSSFMNKAIELIKTNPEINLVFANVEQFGDETGEWIPKDYTADGILRENCLPYASLFKKELWEKVGGFNLVLGKVMQLEDWDFWVRCSTIGLNVKRIDEKLFRYRVHGTNIYYQVILPNINVARAFTLTNNSRLYDFNEIQESWNTIASSEDKIKKRIDETVNKYPEDYLPYFWLGLWHEGHGDYINAKQCYKQSLKCESSLNWQTYYRLGSLNINIAESNDEKMDEDSQQMLLETSRIYLNNAKNILLDNPVVISQEKISTTSIEEENKKARIKLLYYYEGMHNTSEPFAGTNNSVFHLAKLFSENDCNVILSGRYVNEKEIITNNLSLVPLPDDNLENFIGEFETVIFATHLNNFENIQKPKGQTWILNQHCWGLDETVFSRLKDFDKIVCVSNPQLEYYKSIEIDDNKLVVINNGLENLEVKIEETSRERNTIMFAGAVVPHKNVHLLVEAFQLVKTKIHDAKLRIYGSASLWRDSDKYENQLKSLNIPDVEFYGAVPNNEMPSVFQKNSILVLPSELESFGLVSIEAQANGCIPLIHNTGGTSDTLIDGKTGLLYNENTPASISKNICLLLNKVNNDSNIRNVARQFIKDKFNLKNKSIEFLTIIKHLKKESENKLLNTKIVGKNNISPNIIPPEIKNDEFYNLIEKLSAQEDLTNVLEIGSSSGDGSTEAFVKGLSKNKNNPNLFCMEIDVDRFNKLKETYKKYDFVKCYNISTVMESRLPNNLDILDFYNQNNTNLNQYPIETILSWLSVDKANIKKGKNVDGIQQIKENNSIEEFDLVLIDGSEFTGEAELELVYGAKIILLDDINAYKNFNTYHRLKNDSNYYLFYENKGLRNGFAAFAKKGEKYNTFKINKDSSNNIPVHFFTIVLNGEPFIKYHINAFKDLPFKWHWHIIEGVAELKHDTAWSLENGGLIPSFAHSEGRSIDGTSEYIDKLASEYPENITIYRKDNGDFWDGKLEMVEAPLQNINEEAVLWEVDVDEFWTKEQIIKMRQSYCDNPKKTASYYLCHFFVGPKLVITSINNYGNHTDYEWIRTWNYKPGDKWISHEPPKLCRRSNDNQWQDLSQLNPFNHKETFDLGLVFQHYAYVQQSQLRFKEYYYGYKNAVTQWEILQNQEQFPVYLKEYFEWINDEAIVNTLDAINLRPIINFNNKNVAELK